MGKRNQRQRLYRDSADPDYQRWGRKYPSFPGVAECVRLLRSRGLTTGSWRDIIQHELEANAATHIVELIDAFWLYPDCRVALLFAIRCVPECPELWQFWHAVQQQCGDEYQPAPSWYQPVGETA